MCILLRVFLGNMVTCGVDFCPPLYLDLWWGIRGAGPTFGVATRYKARAHPIPVVFAGNLI